MTEWRTLRVCCVFNLALEKRVRFGHPGEDVAVRRAFALETGKASKCLLSCLRGFHVTSNVGSTYFPIILFKEAGPGGKKKKSRNCCKLPRRTRQRPTTSSNRDAARDSTAPLLWKHSWTLTSTFWDITFPCLFCVSCLCTAANDTAVTGLRELLSGEVFLPLIQINPIPRGSKGFSR